MTKLMTSQDTTHAVKIGTNGNPNYNELNSIIIADIHINNDKSK